MATLRKTMQGCAAALAVALLSGCSGWEPIEYQEHNSIPEGPGLISGKKGGWTIFRVEERTPVKKEEKTAEKDE